MVILRLCDIIGPIKERLQLATGHIGHLDGNAAERFYVWL